MSDEYRTIEECDDLWKTLDMRREELERKLKFHSSRLSNEINDLREERTSKAYGLRLQEQLNELKERNVHYHHWVQSKLDEYDNRILISENNREILRELMEHYKENLEYMVEKGALWDFNIEGLDKLLEKLEGKTEKKEPCDIEFDPTCPICIEKKASGGENYTGMITGEQQTAKEQHEGEKPPEPSPCCKKCIEEKKTEKYCNIYRNDCHHYEPRENKKPELYTIPLNWVLVKREDLQFLIKMAKLGCDMNFDFDADGYKKFNRIKEAYGIE